MFPIGDMLKPEVRRIAEEQEPQRLNAKIHKGYALWERSICPCFCSKN